MLAIKGRNLKLINDLNNSIKKWYSAEYKDDVLGVKISPNTTFLDVYVSLNKGTGKNIYKLLANSQIRERVFLKLSELVNVDYNYLYNKWLNLKIDDEL